jgi:phage/plasmid primase-like uncharacterized protein
MSFNTFDFNANGAAIDPVELARSIPIEDELARRGYSFKRNGKDLAGPCPVCGGDDRFVITPSKGLWTCRGCNEGGNVIDLVIYLDKCDFLTAIETLTGKRPKRGESSQEILERMMRNERQRKEREKQEARERAESTAYALQWWNEADCIEGTPAETYLQSRHCDGMFPPDRDAVFRYHPECVFGPGGRRPCLLVLLRNITTNEPQAVHRIAIPTPGEKTERMMLGPSGGAAIKLWPQAAKGRLVVGEGVETVLSAALRLTINGETLEPAWSLVDAGGISSLPPLPGVDKLVILVDNDRPDEKGKRAGQDAAAKCAQEWSKANREVIKLTPKIKGTDFNDLVVKDSSQRDCQDDVVVEMDSPSIDPGKEEDSKAEDSKGKCPDLSLGYWLERDLPEPDYLLGSWLTTTSRTLLVADTGLGKSLLAIAMCMGIAQGNGFLHWQGRRPAKVLFIDGEMSRRVLKKRFVDEVERLGAKPEGFFGLSHEDVEGFAPLNTEEGQKFIDAVITMLGGVDLICFDNIMSLISGDQKDEEGWRQIMPWILSLSKRSIGQIWIHHTGHDSSRSYGTKTREWQMTNHVHLDKVSHQDTDVSFTWSFKKARERNPENRGDFDDVNIALVNDGWTGTAGSSRKAKLEPLERKFFEALQNAVIGNEANKMFGCPAASFELWRSECVKKGLIDPKDKPASARSLFSKHKLALITKSWIAANDGMAWIID